MKILMGENLVYNAPVQVGSHHYARLFAKDNEVMWISLPWNFFLFMKFGKNGDRYKQWNKGKAYVQDGLKIWCPYTFIPYRDNLGFRTKKNIKRMLKFTVPSLEKVLKENNFGSCDVLWITDPRMMELCNMVQYKVLVYRCVDDLTHFSGIPSNIRIVEEKLVKKADIVFATADTLKQRLEGYGQEIISLPNAVDYDFFANYETKGKQSKIDGLENVVLYVGTIGEWFDCKFVRYCANRRPDYNFVVVGPERTDVSMLKGVSNIHLLGSIPYKEVPLLMKKACVGIIPFKMNELVNAVNPLKIYEYFACNLPVVATKSHELIKMCSPAKLYTNYEDGLSYIDLSVKETKNKDYSSFAMDNSWQSRYGRIMELIKKKLQ